MHAALDIHKFSRPIMRHFRSRRMEEFVRIFSITDRHQIIDIGGNEFNWTLIPQHPLITIINIDAEERAEGRFRVERGDARCLQFKDGSFDIAYSNSVIEHVGSWEDQQHFAAEVRRVAPRYYVQTPNRRFIVDPHLLTPFIHFLPKCIARKLMRNFTLHGLITRPNQQWIDEFLARTRMLTETEMHTLFPDAEVLHENVFGMTKSLIAVRR